MICLHAAVPSCGTPLPWMGAVDPGLLPWAPASMRAGQYARATIINAHSLPEIVWSCLLFLLITVDPDIHITDPITTLLRVCVPFFNSLFILRG